MRYRIPLPVSNFSRAADSGSWLLITTSRPVTPGILTSEPPFACLPILDLAALDEVIAVSDGDSILIAQKLARIGLGVGISSGCNFLAAVKAQEAGAAVVVTVFADDNKKYLSTDLMRVEPARPGYIAPEIELGAVRVLPRACVGCERRGRRRGPSRPGGYVPLRPAVALG